MKITELTVAHSTPHWLPLTENWIYGQISNMDYVRSIVLTRQLINLDQHPWQPIYSFGDDSLFLFKIAKKLGVRWHPDIYHKAIQKHNPEILHSHFGHVGWYDLPFASKHSLRHIVTFYGADMSSLPAQKPIWRERYQEMFFRSDLFLCEGPHMARQLVALGCPEEKVQVQRLGVPVEKISYIPRELEDGAPLRVLIAGTFREKKGIPYALEAVGRLYKEGVNIKVTVIGDSRGFKTDEVEKQKILDVIEQFDMHAITRMLGFQPYANLIAEAFQHHVFLSPSVTASDGDTEGGAPIVILLKWQHQVCLSSAPGTAIFHRSSWTAVQDGLPRNVM
jgi:colanic acid/amylovoran biosynthesis glycosyltransferase